MDLSVQHSTGGTPVEEVTCLSDIERSVLLTVTYADLFEYPLREAEILERLILRPADSSAVRRALANLCDRYLTRRNGFVVWRGREHLVDVRRRRKEASEKLWTVAHRYARWLAHVPFVRMVAVSGSLAVRNADSCGDIDFFCIIAPGRLWVARLFIVPLSRATRSLSFLFPHYLCPNYLVTTEALEVADRNLFTAHEIHQAVPVYGLDIFRDFIRANGWTRTYLPHAAQAPSPAPHAKRPLLTKAAERLLGGGFGTKLDALIYRTFCSFYRMRARRRGWSWSDLEHAYGRDRYTVPEGGYGAVVGRLFSELLSSRFDSQESRADLARLFPRDLTRSAPRHYEWEALFRMEYDTPLNAYQP